MLRIGNSSVLSWYEERGRAGWGMGGKKRELAVLRTTFSDCPIFPDPSQRVEDHKDFSKLGVGGVILGTQIPIVEFPLEFGHGSTWRSQKNSQL